MLIMFRSAAVLCVVKSIECMVTNLRRTVSLSAVLSYARNDRINLVRFVVIDHFRFVLFLEIIHIECEQYLKVLKNVLFDLNFPQH